MIQKTIQILVLIGFLSGAAITAQEGDRKEHKDSKNQREHGKDSDHSKHKDSGKEKNSGREHDHSKMKESKGKK
ncbi:hypothetical protein AB3N59_09435 [Leptospira sp. WS92.C1]